MKITPEDFVKKLIPVLKGEFLVNVPLRDYTTFHVGGPADILIFPRFIEDIQNVIKLIVEESMPFIIFGNGSNLLVKDEGFKGAVICLKRYFNSITIDDQYIEAEAGALLPILAQKACENDLSGLEFSHTIPGTVGGAIHNNASAFGQSFQTIIKEIEILSRDGKLEKFSVDKLFFSYRSCRLPIPGIITKARFQLEKKDKSLILKKMKDNVENRNKTQPLNFPSAGSVFRNPPGDFAGRIIESVGLKGTTYGKAQISEKHSNFIVNTGGAKASEIIYLIKLIENTVEKKLGIKLAREIEVIG